MNDVVSAPSQQSQTNPLLRRRNSISTSIAVVPVKLIFPPDELPSVAVNYTSLKDLLPSVAVNSPMPIGPNQAQLGSDICIRNRLVKQAAWAYLQPMSTSSGAGAGNFLTRLLPRVADFIEFVRKSFVRAFYWTFGIIRIRSSR